jgi:hypothetical protein
MPSFLSISLLSMHFFSTNLFVLKCICISFFLLKARFQIFRYLINVYPISFIIYLVLKRTLTFLKVKTKYKGIPLRGITLRTSLLRGNVDKMTPQVKMTPIEIFNVFELSAFLNREVT